MNHDIPDLPDFHVALKQDKIDAGGTVVLRACLSSAILADPGPVEAVIADPDGAEILRARFIEDEDGWHRTALVRIPLPAEPGEYRFIAQLRDVAPADADADADIEVYATQEFAVSATGHATQVVVWDVPGAVEAGAAYNFRVGLRCSCGCNASGWDFIVTDAQGATLASGTTGTTPWEGTTGLYHAEITLTAPAEAGQVTEMNVVAQGADGPVAHSPGEARFRLRSVAPAMHEIRVQAFDVETGEPVARAKVVAHPYRTLADAEGRAVLRVAPGTYTVFVSGTKYFAFKEVHEVAGDISIRADLHHDRVLSVEDMWS